MVHHDDRVYKRFAVILLFIFCFTVAAMADLAAGMPTPKKILMIRGSSNVNTAINEVDNKNWAPTCGGGSGNHPGTNNDVTEFDGSTGAFPANLNTACGGGPCDQIWDLRFDNDSGNTSDALTPAQQTAFLNYVAGGGALLLLGDNDGFPDRNNGIVSIVNTVATGTFAASGTGIVNNTTTTRLNSNPAVLAAAENIDTDYNVITSACANGEFAAVYPGGVKLTEVASGHPFYVTTANLIIGGSDTGAIGAVGIAFTQADMKPAYDAGKLIVWFDYQTFWSDVAGFCCQAYAIRNMMDFLVIDSSTPTPTNTATATATATITNTRTNTPTMSSTSSPTVTNTFTNTPTVTSTRTPTVTNTFTDTFTSSPTVTNTGTLVPTDTFTVTSTRTQTSTFTFTHTFTDTPTATDTFTFTLTYTPTETRTVTFTQTATDTWTASFTPTITPSPTGTNTPTDTFTRTETRTFTATNTPTDTFTVTYTRTATNTATETNTPTDTFTSTSTRTPTETRTPTSTPTQTMTHAPTPVDLTMGLTATGDEPEPGSHIVYTMRITNPTSSSGPANSIVAWDTVPEGMTMLSSNAPYTLTGSLIIWDLGSFVLNPGDSIYIDFEVVVDRIVNRDIPISNVVLCNYNDDYYTGANRHPNITSKTAFYPSNVPVIYPNPYSPQKSVRGELKIRNLVPGAEVYIFTVSGEIVTSLKCNEDMEINWNGENRYGSQISPGIYYYRIFSGKKTHKGKFFVIN